MAYREVAMLEVKEVLRLWLEGVSKKGIAAQEGCPWGFRPGCRAPSSVALSVGREAVRVDGDATGVSRHSSTDTLGRGAGPSSRARTPGRSAGRERRECLRATD
jgi:hypothetical protein